MNFLRVCVSVVLLAIAGLVWLWLVILCGSVYAVSECCGFFNRAVLGLEDDDNGKDW